MFRFSWGASLSSCCGLLSACLVLACSTTNSIAGNVRLLSRPDLGIQVIHFEGEVVKGDLKRLRAVVPKAIPLNLSNQVYVSFHSSGGNLLEGIEIGRYLREQGLGSILLPGATCASSCSFAFWGGFDKKVQKPRRIVMSEARLGVHRASLPNERFPRGSTIDANAGLEIIQKRIAFVMEYLNVMEVSPSIQRKNFATSSRDIYFLNEQDLRENGVHYAVQSHLGWALSNSEPIAVALPPLLKLASAPAAPRLPAKVLPPSQDIRVQQSDAGASSAVSQTAPRSESEDLRIPSLNVLSFGDGGTVFLPKGGMLYARWMYGKREDIECLDIDANPYLGTYQRGGLSATFCFGNSVAISIAYSREILDGQLDIKNVGFVDEEGRAAFSTVSRSRFISNRAGTQEWKRLDQQVHFTLSKPLSDATMSRLIATIRFDLDGDRETTEIAISVPEKVRGAIQRTLSVSHQRVAGATISGNGNGLNAPAVAASQNGGVTQGKSDEPMTSKLFLDTWRKSIGEKVSVEHCTVFNASKGDLSCIVFDGSARVGNILLHVNTMDPDSLIWALRSCGGPHLRTACAARVIGTVYEADGQPLLSHVVINR